MLEYYVTRIASQSESSIPSPESFRLGWKTPLGLVGRPLSIVVSSRLAIAFLDTWGLPPSPYQLTTLLLKFLTSRFLYLVIKLLSPPFPCCRYLNQSCHFPTEVHFSLLLWLFRCRLSWNLFFCRCGTLSIVFETVTIYSDCRACSSRVVTNIFI